MFSGYGADHRRFASLENSSRLTLRMNDLGNHLTVDVSQATFDSVAADLRRLVKKRTKIVKPLLMNATKGHFERELRDNLLFFDQKAEGLDLPWYFNT